ncbi:MAG: endonuclease domain-containing protein [Patescibacteria group bacterium]
MSKEKIFNCLKQKAKRKYLRNNSTPAEQVLWRHLQGKQLGGYKFRRQYSVGKYIVDFYCPKFKLAIEIDGDSHFDARALQYDKKRQEYIESFELKFLRFTNADVYKNIYGVVTKILNQIEDNHP